MKQPQTQVRWHRRRFDAVIAVITSIITTKSTLATTVNITLTPSSSSSSSPPSPSQQQVRNRYLSSVPLGIRVKPAWTFLSARNLQAESKVSSNLMLWDSGVMYGMVCKTDLSTLRVFGTRLRSLKPKSAVLTGRAHHLDLDFQGLATNLEPAVQVQEL